MLDEFDPKLKLGVVAESPWLFEAPKVNGFALDDPNTNFGASDLSSCVFAPNEKLVVAGLFALSELFPNNDVAGLSP